MYPLKSDEKTGAKVCAKAVKISFKQAREIGRLIKGKKSSAAIKYLEEVVVLKKPVPFGRFNTNMAHRSGMSSASYPVNASKKMIELLQSAEKNAEYKGLEVKNLYVKNVWATRASSYTTPKRSPFRGRSKKSANISLLLEEREVKAAKAVEKQKPASKPVKSKPEVKAKAPVVAKKEAQKPKADKPTVKEVKAAPVQKDVKPAVKEKAQAKEAVEEKQEVAKA
ncbi:MAG: 50S ribosomal protein L22 [Candidatus Aenigmarchaeota archaeon]|nr:50S ribosomal protein L22 [Candidatus Aenigmarchaeota archaeon]